MAHVEAFAQQVELYPRIEPADRARMRVAPSNSGYRRYVASLAFLRFFKLTHGLRGESVNAMADITGLLRRAEAGEPQARDAILPVVYEELKRLSRGLRDSYDAPTLNTTALVHEAYLRLIGNESLSWPDRHRFFAYAAQAMRSILIDRARQHLSQKRGGDLQRVEWEAALEVPGDEPQRELLELDAGLVKLEQVDAGLARVVELHVFAGLGFADVAGCLGIAERTAFRSWHKAKAILHGLLAAP